MKVLYVVAASLLSAAASAQQAPAPATPANAEPRTSITATEIADRIRQADAAAKAGTPYRGEPLLQSGAFRAAMEYHSEPSTGFAAHENDAELFVVLDGSGTLSMGGTLVNPTRRGTNLSSPTADGAVPHKLVKGDMILVPEGVPHAVTQVDAGKFVLMTMHLPHPAPTPPAAPATPPAR